MLNEFVTKNGKWKRAEGRGSWYCQVANGQLRVSDHIAICRKSSAKVSVIVPTQKLFEDKNIYEAAAVAEELYKNNCYCEIILTKDGWRISKFKNSNGVWVENWWK